jgi:diguanylate cyclase (GGDEF)-like protein/PAS domain S-box-containing protein
MVSTVDQRVAWVSDSFADHIGVPTTELTGRSIFDLLDGSTNESWADLFIGADSWDDRFDHFGVHLVGDAESVDRFELRGVRYVDSGRNVMISLRLAPVEAEWESNEAFVSDARAAMLSGAIYVAYQPIVDLRNGQLKKLEALARWTHPERGAIGPDVFIPWAERTGVIDVLGEWILERAGHDIVKMEAAGIEVDLSINISVAQLRRADASQRFGDVLARASLAPERVWMEVTESVLLEAEALAPLAEIHALGVRVVIDDFGTGHANFEYLTRLVVDSLKIDTTFVAGLGTESRATAIVRSVLRLGRELGLEIVAEGVENESQRAQLIDLNCRLGQGWLFSPALPYDDLVATYAPGKIPSLPIVVGVWSGTDELVRLSALRACRILDTDPEPAFDSIVRLASQLLSAPIALISLTDADRQWFKARTGTALTEIPRGASFRSVLEAHPDDPLMPDEASRDDGYALHPTVTGKAQAGSHTEVPIRSREGLSLGTLSVVDTSPRTFTPLELGQLALLAEQVSELLDLRRRTVELDDLYIGARHRGRSDSTVIDDPPADVTAAPGGGALAQLTRAAHRPLAAPREGANCLSFDGCLLDLDDRTMSVDGQLLDTPAKEFDLLAFLAARPGQVFTRAELLHHVWNSKAEWQNPSTVTEHIHWLRAKIETDPNRPRSLRTVRGQGYSFQPAHPLTAPPDVTDARCGTWMHVDNRVVAADEGMVALLGARTPADLIGRDVTDFVSPASQPAARASREMRAAGFVPGPQVITMRAMDGTERLTLVSTDAGKLDGRPTVVGIAREIVDAPRLMRQMVSGVVAEVSDAVIVTDPELHVLSWNPAAERLYGWSEEEVLGHTLEAVVRADTMFNGGTAWDELQLNGSWAGAVRQRARDGSTVTVASSVNLLRDHGEITGIAVVNRLAPPRLASASEPGAAALPLTSTDFPVGKATEQARVDAPGWGRALDMSPDAAFDSLTRLAARLMGTPIAAVTLIGRDRQWFMSSVGIEMSSTRRDVGFSSLAIATPDEVFVVNDTALDERLADNPFVTGTPFIRSIAAMPICSREGLPFGTLNVIDVEPREFTEQQIRFLKVLALQAAALLDLRRRAGELDDLIGEQLTEMPPAKQLGAALEESSIQQSGGSTATITRVRRRSVAATAVHTDIDPEASILRLAAARSLLRAEAVEEAVGVVIELVRDLGGSTIPARLDDGGALPIDCSFGHGEPLLPRPDSVVARLRIERILPEVLDDAREAIGRLRQRDDFAELSNTDPLTGLLNRRAIDKLLPRLRRDDALVIIDIDNFKSINDRWGHAAGDDLLITFARALHSRSRPGDQFGRLGGDELLAVLFGAGRAGLDSFLKRLNETWLIVRPHQVTYSAGAALVGRRTGTNALTAADTALYGAKTMGRDQVAVEPTPAAPVAAVT